MLLTTSNLLDWLYNLPKPKGWHQSIVNVSLWLRDEMNDFAQKLSWVRLPALAPEAVPLRSPIQELEAIVTQLKRMGQPIPPEVRSAYQNFQIAQTQLRLYAVTWSLYFVLATYKLI